MTATPSSWNGRLGFAAEEHAADVLRRHGFDVLARRYRCRHGEIDIVACNAETIAFVEVKARRGESFGTPAEAVGRRKQRALARVGRHYLRNCGRGWRAVRFDVIAVTVGGGRAEVDWIADAFRPGA